MSLIGAVLVPHPPLIIPPIGKGQEKGIRQTTAAYEEAAKRIAALKPEVIVVTTPHSVIYSDYFHISPGDSAQGSFREFGAPGVRFSVKYDSAFAQKLSELAQREGIAAGTLGERQKALDHGTMVPLYFVNQYYRDYKLVRISVSGESNITHYRFGKCIAQTAQESGKRVVLIASGDLSHKLKAEGPYGFAEEGPVFDRELTEAIGKGDFLKLLAFDEELCEAAAECGLRSFLIMAGALDGKSVKPELLSYEGPFGVGYAVAAFTIEGEDETRRFDRIAEESERTRMKAIQENEDEYVNLARHSLEHYVKTGRRLKRPEGLAKGLLDNRAGVFVSLKKDGRLRGCIGTIEPTTDCIADEILHNAVSAGMNDPRFDPVGKEELPRIVYSVDVLGKAEPVHSVDQLDAKRYGVIVSSGRRRGLLLPNLPGIDTPEQQIEIALGKAGISPNEAYSIERFEVVRHK